MDRQDHSFYYRYRKVIKGFLLTIFVGLFLTGAYFLTKMGPSRVAPDTVVVEFDEARGAEILNQSKELEEQFRQRSRQRPPTEEDYALLDESIKLLDEYIQLRGGFHSETSEKREELYTLRDELRGKVIYQESITLEEQSREAMEAGDYDKALSLLERAQYTQRKINDEYDRSSLADPRRITRLSREVDQLKAKPLYEESVALEKEAEQALQEERYGRAKLLLAKSIDLQKDVNMRFRNLQYANVLRLADLEERLSSLESSEQYEQIIELKELGELAESEKRYAEAAEAYQRAFRMQRQLNLDHPRSQFAGGRKLDEIQELRENALSRDLGESIVVEMAELDQALLDRRVPQAIELLRNLYPKVQQFTEQYPRSTILEEDALLKLQYLTAVEGDLAFLQDRIYGQLLPIDGVKDWRMLKIEVSQALYMSVMLNANPSRNVGLLLPVDSGSWDDAHDFAERVGWVLGRKSRLPTQEEFYAALGSLRYVNLQDASWNQQNSDSVTHETATKEPNGQGFHDLLGNVAEWLLSDNLPGDAEAYLAGGSSETSIDDLAEVPMDIANRRTRNRFAGFRIVVNFNDE